MNADHVEAAPTGDSAAAPEAARASEQLSLLLLALVRVVYPIGEGPPKHRFTTRVIVPTMSGEAPRRLQHGRRAARRTLQRPVSAGGGCTSALCTSGMAAVLGRLHFNELKCGDVSFGAVV
ncbi:hypothetical protein EVAR_620_1 [Eumeta japonica]|uniref:Uncharacterized protein n=1 Tax=Eumeta variegata TaxID=151549 RepID=A0A4C1SBE4_EUMVA|nr:hypothetical protein EVAR_620_1 [Eumeta japonica]